MVYPNSASSLISDTTLDKKSVNNGQRSSKRCVLMRSRTLSGYPTQNTAKFDQRFSYAAIPEGVPEEKVATESMKIMKESDMSPETREEWGQLHRLLGTPSTLPRNLQKMIKLLVNFVNLVL